MATARKFYRLDAVTVVGIAGVWSVYSPGERTGQYFLEPVDETSRRLADRCPYGMLLASAKQMRNHIPDRSFTNV